MSDAVHEAYPPRFWWLKRIALSLLAVVVVLVLLRLVWGWRVQREYEALIASYRAKGEPTTAADFAGAPVADEENAVPLLRQAAAPISANPLRLARFNSAFIETPVSASDLQAMRAYVGAHGASLSLVRRAQRRPRVNWDEPFVAPYQAPGAYSRDPRDHSEVGDLLTAAVVTAHADGDDAAAVDYIRDVLFISRALDRHADSRFHSRARWLQVRASAAAFQVSRDLAIDGAAQLAGSSGRSPASRRQVAELIAELLDETESDDAAVRSLLSRRLQFTNFREQVFQADVREVARGLFGTSPRVSDASALLLRPVFDRNAMDSLRHIDEAIRALRTADWNTARGSLDRFGYSTFGLPNARFPKLVPFTRVAMVDLLHGTGMFDPSSDIISHRMFAQSRRVAALRLAMRLYELDHEGTLPQSLGALVPGYIPRPPADPFGDGMTPLRYVAGGTAPYLYSFGPNGTDDVAVGNWRPTNLTSLGWARGPDDVYPLNLPPFVAPATMPALPVEDDQQRVADETVYKNENEQREQQP